MAIKKKIRIPKGSTKGKVLQVLDTNLSVLKFGSYGELKEDMEIYLCSGPPDLRTLPQNRYYHGLIIKTIAEHTGDTVADTHDFYKKTFAITFGTFNGQLYEKSKSTSDMHKAEFMEYVEMIRMHALDNFNLYIPEPNEVPDFVYVQLANSGLV